MGWQHPQLCPWPLPRASAPPSTHSRARGRLGRWVASSGLHLWSPMKWTRTDSRARRPRHGAGAAPQLVSSPHCHVCQGACPTAHARSEPQRPATRQGGGRAGQTLRSLTAVGRAALGPHLARGDLSPPRPRPALRRPRGGGEEEARAEPSRFVLVGQQVRAGRPRRGSVRVQGTHGFRGFALTSPSGPSRWASRCPCPGA